MAPDAHFESTSYNPFTVNDNFPNSKSDPDISFYRHKIFQSKRNS